jgi:lytic murein transglycosylase
MRRRYLYFLLLGACAPAVAPAASTVVGPAAAVSVVGAAPAPVQPRPAPPPPASAPEPAADFYTWKAGFRDRAVRAGFEPAFVDAQLAGLAPNERVVALDRRQPEFSRPIGAYVRGALTADRIAEGRRRLAQPWLREIEARYGVAPEVLVGVWAQESAFGKVQGDFDVVRAFATLAADGRRREWAEQQLLHALTIVRDGRRSRDQLIGSWAGAMGQVQFLPENYLRLGQDFDGDGRVDIWTSERDAIASAANLLADAGWVRGQSWAVEVVAPAGFDWSLSETERRTPAGWAELGVRRADGRGWSAADQPAEATLIAPAGAAGPAFLLFPNHFAIRKYNNSVAYALAVGLIGDYVAGRGPVQRSWPEETPLSREQRVDAQIALQRLGFLQGEIDGVIGAGTRAALRAWQKSAGLVADGYLSPEMVARLRTQTSSVGS